MSIMQSISVESSSSTATMATIPSIELPIDSSNGLYEDRDHFQAIFTNDSRFFDTSLHLFKNYFALGYIQADDGKHKKSNGPSLTTTSNGRKSRWRPRLLGSNQNQNNLNGALKAFLTPTLLRKNTHSTSIRSDSGISTTETTNPNEKSPMVVRYLPQTIPIINIPDDDKSEESEVTITRL